jgi:hypothetical protein
MARWPSIQLYVGWEDQLWLMDLNGTAAGCWPRLLCYVKTSGVGGRCRARPASLFVRRWRVPIEDVQSLIDAAIASGNLLLDGDGDWAVADWQQYSPPRDRSGTTYVSSWVRRRSEILERDDRTCAYCGEAADQVDHVIPRSRGGSHQPSNLVAACGNCNRSKCDMTPEEWAESGGMPVRS